MKPVLCSALAKTSLSKNFPRKVLYGPKEEGGLGMNDLWTTQGLMHVQKFHQHIGGSSITSKLLRVTMETCILEVGIGRDLFSLDYNKFGFLVSDCCVKHLWCFCWKNSIQISNKQTPLPPLQRERDGYLMELFQAEGYTRAELIKLNKCRVYIQALTLCDLMTGYGDAFTKTYQVYRDTQKRNNFTWPRMSCPGTMTIKFLKKNTKKDVSSQTRNSSIYSRQMVA